MEDAVLKNVEPTQNILSNSGSLRAPTAWFAIISLALSVLSPGRSQAGVGVTTIFSFKGTNGRYPGTPLIQGPDGSFYGTAQGHFNSSGTVFNLTQSGELNTLATFDGTNGSGPVGPIVRTPDGSIYGTTYLGTNNLGSIYRVSPAGVIEPLFSFNGTNGASPVGLITGLDGAFYGSARYGGLGYSGSQVSGAGSIFRIDTNGNFSTVFKFNGTNGSVPERLILGRDGAFYGITHNGGASIANVSGGYGTVFKLTPDGSLKSLHSFNNTDGAEPLSLIQASDGALYGVAQAGGSTATSSSNGSGTVYRITTDGLFTKLADCDSATELPSSIVETTHGTLYGSSLGATAGSIFRVDPGGLLTVVYTFDSNCLPDNLVQMPGGVIYGTTGEGGVYSFGSIFRLDISPERPLLHLAFAQTNQLMLSWNASVGYSYQVQCCGDIFQQNWTDVGSTFTATNSTVTISPLANPIQGCFYRVVLLP